MHGFYTEQRTLPTSTSLSRDLAQHIFVRGVQGCVIVATKRPQDLAAITKKQWNVLERLVQRERASTLRAARIAELNSQMKWMEGLRFSCKLPEELPDNFVIFAKVTDLLNNPPNCSTLYITHGIAPEEFRLLTNTMAGGSVVVYYKD